MRYVLLKTLESRGIHEEVYISDSGLRVCSFEELPLEEAGKFKASELEYATAQLEAIQDRKEIDAFKLNMKWGFGEVRAQ